MPLVTNQRWANKSWAADEPSLDAEDRATLLLNAWGVPLRKRLLHPIIAHQSIEGGRRFDLDAHSRLEWTVEDKDGLAAFEVTEGELAQFPQACLSILYLSHLPDECRWQHALDVPAGTKFVYQPALTPKEIEDKCVRPPAIVGSYAVRDAAGCKLVHIPRPLAVDAHGNRVWGKIDIQGGISTVTFDRAVLADRMQGEFRIVGIDTFGYYNGGVGGGSWYDTSFDTVWATGPYSPASDGTTDSVHAYMREQKFTVDTLGTLGLYDHDAGGPNNRVVDTGEVTISGATGAWYQSNTDTSENVLAASSYYPAAHTEAETSMAYDALVGKSIYRKAPVTYVSGDIIDPFPASPDSNTDFVHSIYVTYTPAAVGGHPTMRRWGGVPFMGTRHSGGSTW